MAGSDKHASLEQNSIRFFEVQKLNVMNLGTLLQNKLQSQGILKGEVSLYC